MVIMQGRQWNGKYDCTRNENQKVIEKRKGRENVHEGKNRDKKTSKQD